MKGVARILIANRGEIALRVVRSARALGCRAIAVYSDADRDAAHVAAADEAVHIGPAPAHESYLSIERLLAAARRTRADAVHPGYGFLAENAAFAAACREAGLTFIGPDAEAIRAMGDKAEAKRRMLEAGVPCIPGYHGSDQSPKRFLAEAERLGFPVLVKAAAGGGGRGMRLVHSAADLPAALASARSEATTAFGSGELLIERALLDARHVEIQVFADTRGQVLHLGERDCSVQRRHQKVIEEAPSPVVDAALRGRMGDAAVAAARAVKYLGAGTVELLLDGSGRFYFMEMNTRLQVEHPVTELVTGIDLVAWQIMVAAGEPLPLSQEAVRLDGHAMEARLYAEDPDAGFLPQTGRVRLWVPASGEGVRVDGGVRTGQEIGPAYDPLLAKIVAWGPSRDVARRRLLRAVEDTVLLGPITNQAFLAKVLDHPVFAGGRATTAFVEGHLGDLGRPEPDAGMWALAAVLLQNDEGNDGADGWRSTGVYGWRVTLRCGAGTKELQVSRPPNGGGVARVSRVGVDGQEVVLEILERDGERVRYEADGIQRWARVVRVGPELHVAAAGTTGVFSRPPRRGPAAKVEAGRNGDGRYLAPMSGRVVSLQVAAGELVTAGQCLLVLEAMKMEHVVTARGAGTVVSLAVSEGDQVSARQELAVIDAAAGAVPRAS